eukprot:scaffold1062_cov130-Cylindrotheca_fusiformis.AAC.20
MNDGWDDDLDLSQGVDEPGDGWGDEGDLSLDLDQSSSRPSLGADGWDDDDLNLDDVDALEPVLNTPAPPPPPPPLKPSKPAQPATLVEADGWSDDEVDDDLLDTDSGQNNRGAELTAAVDPKTPDDGWNDELDDVLGFDGEDEDLNLNSKTKPLSAPNQKGSQGVGWESDDDFFGDDDEILQTTQSDRIVVNPKREKLLKDLIDYVSSLDRMLSSVNAVLEYEYNTPQKARELAGYYQSREKLAEYTRSKEISRMDYRVVLPDGDVVMDKQDIAQNYMPNESLVSRCSNQSILADLLQVITDKDLLVRPQFMAICVAHTCKFTIHLGDGVVDCACQLHLSVPKADGQRLNIAHVHVSVVFAPYRPMIQYRVNAIDVLLEEYSALESTADFLMECQMDELIDESLQHAPADVYRDQFLVNSQKFFAQSTMGMKSALQEMESVVNFQQKLKMVKRFIPDTDALLAAEQEAVELARAQEYQRRQQQQQRGALHYQMQQPPPTDTENRPKSILGGLVRSGWTKLAKSVNIPDDDPDIYGHAAPPPSFYNRDESAKGRVQNQQLNRSGGPNRPFSTPAPPLKTEQLADLSSGFPRPPPSPAVLQREKSQKVDLSKGFPRGPPSPSPSKKKETLPYGLSKGFPRPPPSPMQPQKQKEHRELSGAAETSQNQMVAKTEKQEVAQLSKGVPRPPPNPPQRPFAAPATPISTGSTSKADGNPDDGWDDDGLDDGGLDLLDEEAPETNAVPSKPMESNKTTPQRDTKEDMSLPALVDDDSDYDEEFEYNPEDDIIPTRKRWVNPRPHRPYVVWWNESAKM